MTNLAQVEAEPSADGLPGAELIQQLLNWGMWIALGASVGAILVGAAAYGLSRESGSFAGAHRGKTAALGGAVGAILAGLATTAVNLLFNAANS
jgi:hypothetical protein